MITKEDYLTWLCYELYSLEIFIKATLVKYHILMEWYKCKTYENFRWLLIYSLIKAQGCCKFPSKSVVAILVLVLCNHDKMSTACTRTSLWWQKLLPSSLKLYGKTLHKTWLFSSTFIITSYSWIATTFFHNILLWLYMQCLPKLSARDGWLIHPLSFSLV